MSRRTLMARAGFRVMLLAACSDRAAVRSGPHSPPASLDGRPFALIQTRGHMATDSIAISAIYQFLTFQSQGHRSPHAETSH
jgi:hypothetical protein